MDLVKRLMNLKSRESSIDDITDDNACQNTITNSIKKMESPTSNTSTPKCPTKSFLNKVILALIS